MVLVVQDQVIQVLQAVAAVGVVQEQVAALLEVVEQEIRRQQQMHLMAGLLLKVTMEVQVPLQILIQVEGVEGLITQELLLRLVLQGQEVMEFKAHLLHLHTAALAQVGHHLLVIFQEVAAVEHTLTQAVLVVLVVVVLVVVMMVDLLQLLPPLEQQIQAVVAAAVIAL